MAIGDAFVECSCDKCYHSENVQMEYVFFDYSGKSGKYDDDEEKIKETLHQDFDWVIDEDNDKIFCSQECFDEFYNPDDSEPVNWTVD